MIEEMLAYNREFVRSKGYEKFQTSKFPDKKIAILTCMDTRLVELLPAAPVSYTHLTLPTNSLV